MRIPFNILYSIILLSSFFSLLRTLLFYYSLEIASVTSFFPSLLLTLAFKENTALESALLTSNCLQCNEPMFFTLNQEVVNCGGCRRQYIPENSSHKIDLQPVLFEGETLFECKCGEIMVIPIAKELLRVCPSCGLKYYMNNNPHFLNKIISRISIPKIPIRRM